MIKIFLKKLLVLYSNFFYIKFEFVKSHDYLNKNQLNELKNLVGKNDLIVIREFENKFSKLVGHGRSLSFASGRMAFYALLQSLNIKANDEVIIQAATCSVMINAILKIGAKPIYSDIDPETFGSSVDSIVKLVNSKTRLIVAQHSFGIPCKINEISKLAKKENIFLLEDCALTLGSKVEGVVCGNFGDAALFSTDHSKPINTLIGGLIYTNNNNVYKKILEIQKTTLKFSNKKQYDLWAQLKDEIKIFSPKKNNFYLYRKKIFDRIFKRKPFPDEDFGTNFNTSYPYPALMPTFLAKLGIYEINLWEQNVQIRKENLKKLFKFFNSNTNEELPSIYNDKNLDIIPHRLVWSSSNSYFLTNKIEKFININWFWFTEPLAARNENYENYYYKVGSCINAEVTGSKIINIPCHLDSYWTNKMIKMIKSKY